jgi:hypothetical protein
MVAITVVAVSAPYWWLRPAWIADDLLVSTGAVLLFVWTLAEVRFSLELDVAERASIVPSA